MYVDIITNNLPFLRNFNIKFITEIESAHFQAGNSMLCSIRVTGSE